MCAKTVLELVLLVTFATSCCNCARILAVAPIPSYSHQIAFRPIWRELSLKGHNVTLITTDPANDPSLVNLTEIDVHDGTYHIGKSARVVQDLQKYKNHPFKLFEVYTNLFERLTDYILEQPQVKQLIRDDFSFDLVMTEPMLHIGSAFALKYDKKLIFVMSVEAAGLLHSALGNVHHPLLYPELMMAKPDDGLLGRILSVGMYLFHVYMSYSFSTANNVWLRKHFGEDLPDIESLEDKVNMLFVNANPLFGSVRPITPSTVYFGRGSHLQPERPLPNDLKAYLDGAENGVVYFSLGSNVQSKDLPEATRKVILEAFEELPFKFLWKFEDDSLQNLPRNVRIAKWLPQQDVLRHPNIRAFITQGGLQSTEEAIFCKVPMIGIPQIADQMLNVDRFVELGMGLRIDLDSLEKQTLKELILEVTTNSSYREKMDEFVKLSTDWPMTGIEEVVWWTEYVLRHNSTEHLKGPARKIPLYEYLLLDVIAIVLSIVVVSIFILFKTVILLFRFVKYYLRKRKAHKD